MPESQGVMYRGAVLGHKRTSVQSQLCPNVYPIVRQKGSKIEAEVTNELNSASIVVSNYEKFNSLPHRLRVDKVQVRGFFVKKARPVVSVVRLKPLITSYDKDTKLLKLNKELN